MWGKAARAPRQATKPSRRTAEQTQNQNTGTPQALPHHPLPALDPPCQNGSPGSAPRRAGPGQGSGGAPTRAGPGRGQAAREGCNHLGPTQSGPGALRGRVRSSPPQHRAEEGAVGSAWPGPAAFPELSRPGAAPYRRQQQAPQRGAQQPGSPHLPRPLPGPRSATGSRSGFTSSSVPRGRWGLQPPARTPRPLCEAGWPRPRGGAAAGGPRLPAGSLSSGGLGGGCGEEPALPAPVLGRGWALCSPQGSQQLVSA